MDRKIISINTTDTSASKTGSWRTMRPVVDDGKCKRAGKKCGLCEDLCPDCAISVDINGFITIDLDYCKGCGICSNECPRKAIKMVEEADCEK